VNTKQLQPVQDKFARPIRDIRVSITDRCNFRCVYCMPKEFFGSNHAFMHRDELLTFEEIDRSIRAFVANGVKKVRITGGEPMIRRNLPELISLLSEIPGVEDLSMTTNASLLTASTARTLHSAGLQRITISLDAIDNKVFSSINDVKFPVKRVLDGIENAQSAGISPIKVNMVVARGMNEDEILPMVRQFHNSDVILRFIEFMDVGNTNDWQMDKVIPATEILETIRREFPIYPVSPTYRGEVAKRWRYKDGKGEIGIISSVTEPFCGTCNRARLTAEGKIFTCLFATSGFDLRKPIREGADVEQLTTIIQNIWKSRTDRYSELRSQSTVALPKVEMSYVGG
jgi:cyclic pyranopterin phosphate synthase